MLPARDSPAQAACAAPADTPDCRSPSRLTAADSISQSSATSSRFTSSFMIYSAIGLRHMLPWQTKSILTQTPPAVFLHHITQSRNRHAISKPTIPVNGMRASFFPCKTIPRRMELYSLSIRRGISIMRSCSSYCGSCDPAIHQPVSKKPLLDSAVRFFRCTYTIADFRSSNVFFHEMQFCGNEMQKGPALKREIVSRVVMQILNKQA